MGPFLAPYCGAKAPKNPQTMGIRVINLASFRFTQSKIKEEVGDLSLLWPGLNTSEPANQEGSLCQHFPRGKRKNSPFGVGQFEDQGELIDELNERISRWSRATDKVCILPRQVPQHYLQTDPDDAGKTLPPSIDEENFFPPEWNRDQEGKQEVPSYIAVEGFDHEAPKAQWENTLLAFLMRNEISPALVGWQFGMTKESGEAKALGMGTTEAAVLRTLLQVGPRANVMVTTLGKLVAIEGPITVLFRVGLPKGEEELRNDIEWELKNDLTTKKRALKRLHPGMTDDQIDEILDEIDEENEKELDREAKRIPTIPSLS